MKFRFVKRVLSGLLVFCMLLFTFPLVSAAEPEIKVTYNLPSALTLGQPYSMENDGAQAVKIENIPAQYDGYGLMIQSDIFNHFFNQGHSSDMTIVTAGQTNYASLYADFDVGPHHPGQIALQAQLVKPLGGGEYDFDNPIDIGEPFVLTVEEPSLLLDAPSQATVGDTVSITASLQNLYNPSALVEEIKQQVETSGGYSDIFGLEPKIEILEGADLVEISGIDCSTIGSAKATLAFKGEGNVKIKVSFQQIKSCNWCLGGLLSSPLYSVEKTFDIAVTKKPVILTDDESQVSVSGGHVPESAILEVQKDAPASVDKVLEALQNAKIAANGTPVVFDITLRSPGQEAIQPSGMVTVTLPIPENYLKHQNYQELLQLFYVSGEGALTEIPVTVLEKTVSFQTDHFSTYALLLKKDSGASSSGSTPPVEQNTSSSNSNGVPATGGSLSVWIIALFFLSGVSAFCLAVYKKKKAE